MSDKSFFEVEAWFMELLDFCFTGETIVDGMNCEVLFMFSKMSSLFTEHDCELLIKISLNDAKRDNNLKYLKSRFFNTWLFLFLLNSSELLIRLPL